MDEEINIQGDIDINKALKEFEMKASQEQVQKTKMISKTSEAPKMVELVMKHSGGIVKEQRQAEYILLGFVVLTIVISLFIFFGGGNASPKLHVEGLNNIPVTFP